MSKKATGLLALLGLAGGAFAYWKYRNMSDEEKAALKSKVKNVGTKIKDTAKDVEKSVSESFSSIKQKAKEEMNNMSS
jgi:hypothetical protein